jgi:hypothetical protein
MRSLARRRRLAILCLSPLAILLALGCSGDERAIPTDVSAGAAAPPPPPPPPMADQAQSSKVAGFALERRARQEAASAPQRGEPTGGGAAASPAATSQSETITPSMLIRTGSASVEVQDLDRAMQQVTQLATRVGGFVANTSVQAGRDQVRAATLELRIPAARWDEAVKGLEPLGRVEAVNVAAEDVGEEYTDLTARVANARRLEERLLQLLATRTGKLEDVLAVERELARVREEVERMEGRMRWLRARAATSTLSVNLHEPYPVLGSVGSNPIVDAFRRAWVNFVGFVAGFIGALGFLVPLGALLAGAWWLWRRFAPRRRPRAPRATPGVGPLTPVEPEP